MAAARFYSSTSGSMSLSSGISAAATSIAVNSVVGLPGTTPFTLVLDPGISASEEIVTVTNVAGTTLTIVRAEDGTSAKTHSAGAEVRHMATARDFREPQEHIGAAAAVHGLSGTVVGTTDAQTLTNKTAQAASAATVGLVVKGAASQTASYLDVQDSAGTSIVKVQPGQNSLSVNGTTDINTSGAATLFGYVARFTSSTAAAVTAILKAAASQTADILQIQNSAGTTLAKFDKDGKLTAPQVTSTGTGSFAGAITSPTITSLQSADTSLDTRVTAVETNLGAQTTFAATSAAKDKKQLHWGTYTVTTDASGYATVTHSAGFTPTVVVPCSSVTTFVSGQADLTLSVDTFGATTFRVRAVSSTGATLTSASITFTAILGE